MEQTTVEGGRAPVSAVVPCYRCAGTIERAVRSVAAQTRRPAELILIDDCSGDGTADTLERLRAQYGSDWIRVIRLPLNVGSGSARNAGWESANQPYLAFLDADDAWHPRKVEIQLAWMEAHPDVAVTGHASRQLAAEADIPGDVGADGARDIGLARLYLSNPFITPSVMLRRDLGQRFEHGKRHMEDYLLWLEIAASGGRVAKLEQELAYTFKAPFGETGLSAQPWKMERGELAAFATLWRKRHIGGTAMLLLSAFSLLKFARRVLMLLTGYSPNGAAPSPALFYVGAYLFLTQSMTGLLVLAGFFGPGELAADIAVVQAATLATFFAFSGNARNLILTERANVSRRAILAGRLALLLPLGGAAALLCAIVGNVDVALVFILIARRGIEWIGELYLSECELLGRQAAARRSFVLQVLLLAMAAGAIVFRSEHLLWALAAWALLPALPLARFVAGAAGTTLQSLREAMRLLLPHFGATAASGVSLYAFRVLLVLVAGKAVAGDLFAAFAVGSFPGSVFANVLGATVSLHEERVGRRYLPRGLWFVTIGYLLAGLVLLALAWASPGLFAPLGKEPLFWMALGLSLLGGVTMIVAQRVRLKLIARGEGRDLFGADILMHVYLIAAVPALYSVGQDRGLALLYLLNGLLALVFYASALRANVRPYGEAAARRLAFGVALLVFLPVFFMLSGQLFHPPEPVVDSGGILRNLPLPVSLLACSAGLLLCGSFSRAIAGLWAIFGLLLMMLMSTTVAGGDSETLDRNKMLLLLQVLLPTFGLVLGSVLDPKDAHRRAIELAIFWVVALVVPAQLLASYLDGSRTLRHSVFLFGVYQHLQFVPVILVCAWWLAFAGLWPRWGIPGRIALSAILSLVAGYAVTSHSVLAMVAMVIGTLLLGARWVLGAREPSALLALAAALCGLGVYHEVIRTTYEYQHKFSFLVPAEERVDIVAVTSHTPDVKPRWEGGWRINGGSTARDILVVAHPEKLRQATLVVEGHLEAGKLAASVRDSSGLAHPYKVHAAGEGPFRLTLSVDRDQGDQSIWFNQAEAGTRGLILHMSWRDADPHASQPVRSPAVPNATAQPVAVPAPAAPETLAQGTVVRNVSERFSDWRLFGRGIFEAPGPMLFGHAKPLAREQRTSAHNFYIDFTYNFGLLALLPLAALVIYTGKLLWSARRVLLSDGPLLALALVVAFLVLVENNLKVTLRQPYPGIAVYFLWGLLLSRLHLAARGGADAADVTDRLQMARP